jgi:hypothetical protein
MRDTVIVGGYEYRLADGGQWGIRKVGADVPFSLETWPHTVALIERIRELEALAARNAGAGVREEGFGPTVTVRRSCDDCKACVTESYVVQGDSGQKVRCAHPSLAKPKYIGDTSWETPQWCPALVDAEARDAGAEVRIAVDHRNVGVRIDNDWHGNYAVHTFARLTGETLTQGPWRSTIQYAIEAARLALVDADAADSHQSVPSDHSAAAAGREVTEDMVEAAARSWFTDPHVTFDSCSDFVQNWHRDQARIALTAALARDGGVQHGE